jgi:DNA repair protein RadC
METLAAVLRPVDGMQVKSPADIAGLLMVEMGHLTHAIVNAGRLLDIEPLDHIVIEAV